MAFSNQAAPEPGMKEAAPALPTEPELCNTLWAEWPAPASGNGTGAAGLTLQREHQRRTQEEAAPHRASSFLKHSHSANPKDLCLDCPRCCEESVKSQTVLCLHYAQERAAMQPLPIQGGQCVMRAEKGW